MTHALINALSQIAVDEKVIVGIILKIVCMAIAVGLYYMVLKQKAYPELNCEQKDKFRLD